MMWSLYERLKELAGRGLVVARPSSAGGVVVELANDVAKGRRSDWCESCGVTIGVYPCEHPGPHPIERKTRAKV